MSILKPHQLVLLVITSVVLVVGVSCKKPQTYSVTYSTTSTPPYFVGIWDATNINDFGDSIYTPTFTKTIIYDYTPSGAGWQASIESNTVSAKTIQIDYNNVVTGCTDTLYKQLTCQRIP